ncbi:MAG: UvrD-helicase domain-containing protein [Treponema sp.]|jgi:ATP-dependent helicase/nuclease subunit A|nr:UvrD-helicase domain-containing protein [Treponema sp.]
MLPFLSELDGEQYAAATSVLNATVSAGAGSGKTRVLAARYLWLITQGICRVEEILTITFTNKAANEMHDRIYRLLLENRDIPEARAAVDNFHNAAISTLDSFCASVARSASRLYGVSPDFSPDMGGIRELARTLALRFVLDHRNNPGLKDLIAEKKIRLVADELFAFPALQHSLISQPLDYADFARRQREKLLREWKEKTAAVSHLTAALKEDAQACDSEFTGEFAAILAAEKKVPGIEAFLNGGGSDIVRQNTEEYFSFLHGAAHFPARKRSEQYIRFKQHRDELKDNAAELEAIANYILQWDIVEAIYPLMEEYQNLLAKKKRESGILGFSDIARLAVDALSRDADLRQMYKKAYKKIMIDEFQDNNALQRDLVYLLAEKYERREKGVPRREDLLPDKVFFVGDEKQSIYRFRGADVSVFRGLAGDFSAAGKNLSLSCNYRSSPMLIKAFNRIFGGLRGEDDTETFLIPAEVRGIFPPRGQEGASYEASYSRLKSRKPAEAEAADEGKPMLHFAFFDKGKIDEDNPGNAETYEAAYIAWKINEMVTQGHEIYDRKEKKKRPCAYQDFAVLQRSCTRQYELEKQLKSYGVPFSADRPTGLFDDAPVNDLSALLRLLVYPSDRIAYAALLRSPLLRLSDAGFTVCMMNPGEPFAPELEELVPAPDRELYRRGGRLYRELRGETGKLSVAELVTKLWYREGYRYETLWSPSAQAFSDLYDLLFELARFIDGKGKGLPEFLDYLDDLALKEENADDAELPDETGNGVRLMSIHKCKGLEFPVVFIFNCGRPEKARAQTSLACYSERWGVSLKLPPAGEFSEKNSNYFFLLEKEDDDRKSTAELRRLLYVAMTRAEYTLYVTSSLPLLKESEKKFCDPETGGYTPEYIKKRLAMLCVPGLNPNSFLNLLIPVLAGADNSCFTVEPIYDYIRKGYSEEKNGMRETVSRALPFYEKTPVPETEVLYPPVIPASELHAPYRSAAYRSPAVKKKPQAEFGFVESGAPSESGDMAGNGGDGLEPLLKTAGLSSEAFGTIVHGFIEARFKNQPEKIPPRILAGIRENQAVPVKEKAREMADKFFNSALGAASVASAFREIEFPVLSAVGDSIVSGKIDLLFEHNGELYIVDFKTDKYEDPHKHSGQLALYRRAVSDIYGKPVRCRLFFVRSGRAVELDDDVLQTSPEELVAIWKAER